MTQEELLKYALESGMIDLDKVSKVANQKILKMVKDIHRFKITQPSFNAKDPRWQTHVEDSTKRGNRRQIKGNTEEELLLKLAKHYGIVEEGNTLTMNEMFNKWIPYKRSITNSENTIYRHYDHWRRYCEKCDIIKKPIKNISVIELESWANELIKDNNMTRKEWQNVKVIIGGIWDFAHRKGYISKNTWKEIRITVKYRQITKQPPETQVFI